MNKILSTIPKLHTNCYFWKPKTWKWTIIQEEVVHPLPQTPQGEPVAKPGTPLLIILSLVCKSDISANVNHQASILNRSGTQTWSTWLFVNLNMILQISATTLSFPNHFYEIFCTALFHSMCILDSVYKVINSGVDLFQTHLSSPCQQSVAISQQMRNLPERMCL